MEWIFDHLQILIAAGAAVAYWLNQRQQANAGEESQEESLQRENPEAMEEAERARRIREEIRRKIAERAGGERMRQPTLQEAAPPLYRRAEVPAQPKLEPVYEEQVWNQGSGYLVDESAAVLERQRKLQKQLEALKQPKQQLKMKSEPVKPVAATSLLIGSLRHDLRKPSSLRRAIVLREVLDRPVALR